ncbi:MAG TPA: colicin E3/pyocin S6 family cytotoxin [Prolixibacteraceae bacterium]|nr:colicin E3/pyocin S6 family cytotoxin [Prolixibacteraceae bacterium]
MVLQDKGGEYFVGKKVENEGDADVTYKRAFDWGGRGEGNTSNNNQSITTTESTNTERAGIELPIAIPLYVTLGNVLEISTAQALAPLVFMAIPGDTPDYKTYQPAPRELHGFPGSVKVKAKTKRARWKLPNGDIAEWDSQEGEVEVYDKTGKNHKGAYDPNTGKQKKPGKPERHTKK